MINQEGKLRGTKSKLSLALGLGGVLLVGGIYTGITYLPDNYDSRQNTNYSDWSIQREIEQRFIDKGIPAYFLKRQNGVWTSLLST